MKRFHAVVAGMLVLIAAGVGAFAQYGRQRSGIQPAYSFRELWLAGLPRDWGRIVQSTHLPDGSSAMFFESYDGTLRRVVFTFSNGQVQYDPDVIVIPRSATAW